MRIYSLPLSSSSNPCTLIFGRAIIRQQANLDKKNTTRMSSSFIDMLGARDRNRTGTFVLGTTDFKSVVSTNSTTRANGH